MKASPGCGLNCKAVVTEMQSIAEAVIELTVATVPEIQK